MKASLASILVSAFVSSSCNWHLTRRRRRVEGDYVFYKDDRLALFIDGANLYAAAKSLGFDIDYKLLRQEFERRGKLLRAYYYTALLENEERRSSS